jgi:diguanylate cyclase (GGDEF)-like protein
MARSSLAQQASPQVHILLVEDTASDAFLVESLLGNDRATEYRVHCVRTQAEALAALASQEFDVCLLDLTLSDASGFSALIDIQEKAPDMPVLILTGINDTALAKRAVGRGAQDYLLKDEMEITGLGRAIDYAMERKRIEKTLFQRANCDALTGLANREAFLSRLGVALVRAERSGACVAILFIDLDRFKPINDAHGHDAGDEALKIVAQRIRSALRAYDLSARFGGDEFAVLLENMASPRDAAHIAQKIIKARAAPMAYRNQSLELGASIGIAFSDAPITAEALLQCADTAMYHTKKEGGGSYHFYAQSMQEEALARLSLEEDLRGALATEGLRLHYQPYVNPDGEAVIGVEALLRWAHPGRGLLCAHEFLPAAERARLMPDIAQWTCRQLHRDIALWNTYTLPPLHIAINLSVSQLDAPDLSEWLAAVARQDFLGSHRLAVEIPEEAVTSLSEQHYATIIKISAMGIGLHLDHFGRGSLSLTALHSLPFCLLKLDMSLIKKMSGDVSGDVLIRTAILLAHHLGMKAGAVGVEMPWQAAMLKAQACDTMQGNLTVPPMSAEALAKWLVNRA